MPEWTVTDVQLKNLVAKAVEQGIAHANANFKTELDAQLEQKMAEIFDKCNTTIQQMFDLRISEVNDRVEAHVLTNLERYMPDMDRYAEKAVVMAYYNQLQQNVMRCEKFCKVVAVLINTLARDKPEIESELFDPEIAEWHRAAIDDYEYEDPFLGKKMTLTGLSNFTNLNGKRCKVMALTTTGYKVDIWNFGPLTIDKKNLV